MAEETIDPVISIKGLYKSFGDLHVLRGVDLEVKKEKTWLFLAAQAQVNLF